MKKKLLIAILLLQTPFLMTSQNDKNFEVQADTMPNQELQIFQKKFNDWINSIKTDSPGTVYKTERMVNNFILFSEDGLMMKDLKFHSAECSKQKLFRIFPVRKAKLMN